MDGFKPEELGLEVLVQAAVEEELVQQEVEMAVPMLIVAVEELFQEVPGQEEERMEVLMPVGEVAAAEEVVVVLPREVASMLNQELQTLASLHYQRLDTGIWRILRTLTLSYSEPAQ